MENNNILNNTSPKMKKIDKFEQPIAKNFLNKIKEETNLETIVMNYSKPETFKSVIEKITTKYGKIDIFISSAGVHTENVDFWTMSQKEFDRVMDINLKGVFFACQTIGRYMVDNKIKGSILLISSSRGSEPAWSPYGISKWGLKGLTEGLAQILIPYGINVNALSPGIIKTEMTENLEYDMSVLALRRFGERAEVADVAAFLLAKESDYLTGNTIDINGGLYMR